ncbi:MAG: YceI family protein [Burkholderiaceae bacterium]
MNKTLSPVSLAAIAAFASTTMLAAAPASAEETTYMIESSHTYPSFRAPHLGISWWTGKFNKTTGSIKMDQAAGKGTVNIVIDAASVDFGHEKMNQHALKEDFFNVAAHPEITYTGNLVFDGDTPSGVEGELTMIGKTLPVNLTINSFKCIVHPMLKREVCGADVEGEFNRRDFGMTYASRDAAGGVAKLTIQVEALKQ